MARARLASYGVAGTRGGGFTLIELLVVMTVVAVLIAVLLPSLREARDIARTLQCAVNVRSLGQALANYGSDNKGYFPLTPQDYSPAAGFTLGVRDWYRVYRTYLMPPNVIGTTMDAQRNIYALGLAAPVFGCPSVRGTTNINFNGPTATGLWIGGPRKNVFNYVFNNWESGTLGIDGRIRNHQRMETLEHNRMIIIDKDPRTNWNTTNLSAAANAVIPELNGARWGMFIRPFAGTTVTAGSYAGGTHHRSGANILFRSGDVRWFQATAYYTAYPNYVTLVDLINK